MNIHRFVSDILQKGVRLWVNDGKLCFRTIKKPLTLEIREEIANRKSEIINILEENKTYALTSFAQQRLWFLDRFTPDNPFYNVPFAVRLKGDLNKNTFKNVIDEIVNRHETLRTTFTSIDGQPVQVISSNMEIEIPEIDLSNFEGETLNDQIQSIVIDEALKPFNLSVGPLMRIKLLIVNEQEYILLLTMHHIISDGWSMRVFVQEVNVLYEAFYSGSPSPLPQLPIQYVDFALWQKEKLKGTALDKQLLYWEDRLKGAHNLLQLPTDRPRPPVLQYHGARYPIQISKDMTKKLKDFGNQEGATLYMVLLSVFGLLMGKLSAQKDIVIGSPIANRNKKDIEELIGFFVNMLALRFELNDNMSFNELLRYVKEITLEAYDHQDIPFEMVIEKLKPERSFNYTPLTQVVFTLQGTPLLEKHEMVGLEIEPLTFDIEPVRFDIEFQLWETENGIEGIFAYSTDLFDSSTAKRFLDYYERLLENCINNPEQQIGDIKILSDKEENQILVEWNNTDTEYDRNELIHQLFEKQAQKAPQSIAAVYKSEQITYCDLNKRANQLAHYLHESGIGYGKLVGIYMEKSIDMLIGLLGILKAGAAYLPLDPRYPMSRIAFMLEDMGITLILTQKSMVDQIPTYGEERKVICLDAEWQWLEKMSSKNLNIDISSNNIAYVIYTSGSTGNPKGVMICHKSVINLIQWVNHTFSVNSMDRLLFVTSLCFDLSVYDIFGILAAGGTIVIPPEDAMLDPHKMLEIMCREKITFWDSAPATIQQLTHFFSSIKHMNTTGLRVVFLSGDWIPVSLPDLIRETFTSARVISLGGATEATIWSNYYKVEEVPSDWTSIPYGKPINNARYYILDSCLNPCPVGVPGNLFIGGECLSIGYANRPDLTAERFIPNPYSNTSGGRMYNTGDIACYMSDGNIIFMGRRDNQVKIRGFRIELGEIEVVIGLYPGVRESVVLVKENDSGDKRLVAFIVSELSESLSVKDIRSYLAERLPDYMLPASFIIIDGIPLTSNGKIDRKALLEIREEKDCSNKEQSTPRNQIEEEMCQLWSDVLGVDDVGVNDNFFELGGHSLIAPQLLNRIQETFKVEIPVRDLFETPTVANLSLLIIQEQAKKIESEDLLKILDEIDSLSDVGI